MVTIEPWGKLTEIQQVELFDKLFPIFRDCIEYLKPDVVFLSWTHRWVLKTQLIQEATITPLYKVLKKSKSYEIYYAWSRIGNLPKKTLFFFIGPQQPPLGGLTYYEICGKVGKKAFDNFNKGCN